MIRKIVSALYEDRSRIDGYQWPYIPAGFDHRRVIQNIIHRFQQDDPPFPVIVTDTHNDHDYGDPDNPVTKNFHHVIQAILAESEKWNYEPVGVTIAQICDLVRQPA